MSEPYDCIVMGGGPGGATAAALLAEGGHRVVVVERGASPRRGAGASLMPQCYWSFKRLGLLEKMKHSSFVRRDSLLLVDASVSRTVASVSRTVASASRVVASAFGSTSSITASSVAAGGETVPLHFAERDPNEWSTTWQVRRDEFDAMLLEHARHLGAEVRRGAEVRDVLFDGSRVVGVSVLEGGVATNLRGRVVVDATGTAALLARRLGLRRLDDRLRHAAIYACYRGGRMEEGRHAGATVMARTKQPPGWFWYVPLREADGMVSVGVVAPTDWLCTGRGDDPAAAFDEELAGCPAIAARLADAKRLGDVRLTADFTGGSRQVAGDGWVLVGDAFVSLDPVFGSGLMLAMKSGEQAADAIAGALADNDLSGRRLGIFGPRLVAGIQNIRRLIHAFYSDGFDIGAFMREHPGQADSLMRLVIGDVFNDEVAEVFDVLGGAVDLPEPMGLVEDAVV